MRLLRALDSERWAWTALLILLASAFLLGGSARGDVDQLIILHPISWLCLGAGLACITRKAVRDYRLPLLLASAAFVLPLLQLVPLPPEIWQRLPGRALVVEIDRAAGIGQIWRPLTLARDETVHALIAAVLPIAVILLASRLAPSRRAALALVALAVGCLSAVLGLLQVLGDPQGPLYLFEKTNNGSAVGVFANRNHQAAMLACMIPLMFAATRLHRPAGTRHPPLRDWRLAYAIGATCVIVPLILVTGSRAGLIVTAIALVSLPVILPPPGRSAASMKRRIALGVAAVAAAGIAATAIWLDRDEALDRLTESSPADDLRVHMLPTLQEMVSQYIGWGTGLGSFQRVYQVHEPAHLLMPAYVNHAHNDWIELAITGGLPALAILLVGLVGTGVQAARTFTRGYCDRWNSLRRASLVCLVLLGLASLSDYPLRTPHLAALAALCMVWLFMRPEPTGSRSPRSGPGKPPEQPAMMPRLHRRKVVHQPATSLGRIINGLRID